MLRGFGQTLTFNLTVLLLFCSSVSAAELLSFAVVGGSSVNELKRSESLSELEIRYGDDLINNASSRGMFAMYAACQIANDRNSSHYILLSKKSTSNNVDQLVVGVTSDSTDTINAKWENYKDSVTSQNLQEYTKTCKGLELFYKRKIG